MQYICLRQYWGYLLIYWHTCWELFICQEYNNLECLGKNFCLIQKLRGILHWCMWNVLNAQHRRVVCFAVWNFSFAECWYKHCQQDNSYISFFCIYNIFPSIMFIVLFWFLWHYHQVLLDFIFTHTVHGSFIGGGIITELVRYGDNGSVPFHSKTQQGPNCVHSYNIQRGHAAF